MPRFGSGGDMLKCSFCGKTQEQVVKLIAGPGVYICDECIDLCNEIIVEEVGERPGRPRPRPTDDEIEEAARDVNHALSRLRLLALGRRDAPEEPPPTS